MLKYWITKEILPALVNKLSQIVYAFVVSTMFFASVSGADRREYQHGVQFVSSSDSSHWLIWSSSQGNPPSGKKTVTLPDGSKCSYFTHDVYYSMIENSQPEIDAQQLIRLPEAQEPVSAAVSVDGSVLVTFEDGSDSNITSDCWGVIQQRYKLFTSALQAKTELRTVAKSGAHSGHATAVDNQFVIVYSEGWVDSGGDDNFGTGKTIFLDMVNTQGELLRHRRIEGGMRERDWWPLVAGSTRYAFLLWQRYVENSHRANLMYAVYDPVADQFVRPPAALQTEVYYYHYDVQYLLKINRFIVSGNHLGPMIRESNHGSIPLKTQKGFVYLLSEQGEIVDHWSASQLCEFCGGYHTHPFVREAQPAIYTNEDHVQVLYPVKPKGVLLFLLGANAISLQKYISHDYYWHSLGTDGIFLNSHTAYFANLSPLGLQTTAINIE